MKRLLILASIIFTTNAIVAQLNAEKYIALAREDLKTQSYTMAIQRLNFAIKAKPYLLDAYFLRASAKYRLNDYKGATEDYTQCIRINPLSAASFQNRGIARSKYGDHFGAIEDYKLALKIDPLNYFLFIQKASSEVQIEEFEDALKSAEKAISINPYLESGYILKGIILNHLEEYEEAVTDFKEALKIAPNNPEPWLRMAVSNSALLQPQLALANCDSAIRIDSTSSLGHFIKGNILADQLEYAQAEASYSRVIDLNPSNALAFYNRGNVRVLLDKYDNAAYDFSRVVDINPENILAHYNLALTFHKMDKYKLAEEEYTAVIELYPDMEDAWFNRAFVRRKLGNESGAQLDFVKGNSIRGKNREKEFNLEEEAVLKRFTKMDANFYNPNFDAEEQKLIVLAIPFFDLKNTFYKQIDKKHLYYNTELINDFNETYKNTPYFYASNYLLNEPTPNIQSQKEALNEYLKSSSGTKDERYYLWKATNYKAEFDFNQAIATYDSLIAQYPKSALGYFNKANTMLDLLELLLKLETGNGAFIDVGEEYQSTGLKSMETVNIRLKEIELLYERSIELEPEFYYAWFNKAIVLAEQKEFDASVDAYTKAIKINNEFKEAYLNRGLSYLFLENPKKACNDLSKAGELGLVEAYQIIKKYCQE